MDAVIAALVSGVLALVGVFVSTRNESRKTRDAGLAQHTEQNAKLDTLLTGFKNLESKVDENKVIAETGLQNLNVATETLFGMIVEVDRKVTKPVNKKTTAPREVAHVASFYERGKGVG